MHVARGDDGKEGVPKDGGRQLRAAALPRAASRNPRLLWLHALRRNGNNASAAGRKEGREEERARGFPNAIMCLVHAEPELSGRPAAGLQRGCGTAGRGPWGPSPSKGLTGCFNRPGWNFSTKA